ncbi:hypothetical protein E2C01_064466 [Portunus trituberculatus]|uniref:Uncharacterized protein n=1 Tax=Portunus trituberculatus TaxID=210409 RepID=A0A5B7HNU6_PORTR|nr:hypothetical protein [Portunus trituberculatus]
MEGPRGGLSTGWRRGVSGHNTTGGLLAGQVTGIPKLSKPSAAFLHNIKFICPRSPRVGRRGGSARPPPHRIYGPDWSCTTTRTICPPHQHSTRK